MSPRGIAFVCSLVVVVVVAVLVDRLLRPSLRQLLEEVTGLPAATEFYLRSFAIVVFFVAAAACLGSTHSDLKSDSRFMEYVWSVAGDLQSVLQGIFGVLLGYVALITILIAALRRRQP
ncbi:MAG TPA: hypothetical protein VE377_04485 [Candidatus Dormibacteraeota bacterium]|nr:hypothetical protein [Candidatus Dormibacteraeota bacterium]